MALKLQKDDIVSPDHRHAVVTRLKHIDMQYVSHVEIGISLCNRNKYSTNSTLGDNLYLPVINLLIRYNLKMYVS